MVDSELGTPNDLERDVADAQPGDIEGRVADLERRTLDLKADINRAARVADQMAPIRRRIDEVQDQAASLRGDTLAALLTQAQDEASLLYFRMRPLDAPAVPQPPIEDVRRSLPSGVSAPFPVRADEQVRRIVVHHTATSAGGSPEQIARDHIASGKPGISYHFLIASDGTIYWAQPLETAVPQTGIRQVNEEAIGVALIGNFALVAPRPSQIAAAAALIAWLLSRFDLSPTDVVGRRELERVGSPGAQWNGGSRYRDALLAHVRAILWSARAPETILSSLRQELGELRARVVHGERLSEQVADLQQQIERIKASRPAASHTDADPQLSGEGRGAAIVEAPKWQDVVKSLPRHPSLKPYPQRSKPPTTVVLHHTDTPPSFTVEQIARYHVYGERRDTDGTLIKGPWPGIGYHFVIAANGIIYKCHDTLTRSYHVGGAANDYSIGVALIGRFMRLGYDGKPQKADAQAPTPAQLKSAGRLTAWLMQAYKIPADRVLGHRDIWPRSTQCPGEFWRAGSAWRNLLLKEIQIAQDPHTTRQIEHYLLFWDHGVQWAQADWKNAQAYIARFRSTCGFSVEDALVARRVTIVGGTAGVSASAEARLKAAGIVVHRLAGGNEAETKALLDALVAKGTPWPGAPTRTTLALEAAVSERDMDDLVLMPIPDEWTVPDDWTPL